MTIEVKEVDVEQQTELATELSRAIRDAHRPFNDDLVGIFFVAQTRGGGMICGGAEEDGAEGDMMRELREGMADLLSKNKCPGGLDVSVDLDKED